MIRFSAFRRRVDKDDSGAAILLVILTIMVLSAISLLILGTITSRVAPTAFAKKAAQTLHAAEAGIEAGTGAIKNSVSVDPTDAGNVTGDRNILPCWTDYEGTVGEANSNLRYKTTITYFLSDPVAQSDTWRNANKMSCTTGYGPTSGAPDYSLPKFALIHAEGVGVPAADDANRIVEAIYTFSLKNENVSGGTLGWGTKCFDAGGAPYTAGRRVQVKNCVTGALNQMWSHQADFTVALSETRASGAAGLCLQSASAAGTGDTTLAVTLQPCDSSRAEQRWGFNDGRALYVRPTGNWDHGTWCMIDTAGDLSARRNSCSAMDASPRIGSGAAGTTSDAVDGVPLQWVNYKRFGRCYDITDWILNSSPYSTGRPSEILYPCKQDPMRASDSRARPGWNQVFTWHSATLKFVSNANVTAAGFSKGSGPYDPSYPEWCMKSPNNNGGYVTFDSSCNTASKAFQWTVNRATGNSETAYTIVDGYGRCLAAGDSNPSYPSGYQTYFSVITETCNGSNEQKWNAPPTVDDANVSNFRERTAG